MTCWRIYTRDASAWRDLGLDFDSLDMARRFARLCHRWPRSRWRIRKFVYGHDLDTIGL